MPILTSLIGVLVTLSAVVVVVLGRRRCRAKRRRWPRCSASPSASTTPCSSCRATGATSPRDSTSVESMSRALATAGSAVVFAGATVDHRPGRTRRRRDPGAHRDGPRRRGGGRRSPSCVALTLLPAIALLLGERLRPRAARPPSREGASRSSRDRRVRRGRCLGPGRHPLPRGHRARRSSPSWAWRPCRRRSMRLALPDNSTAPTSSTAAADLRQDHGRLRGGLQRAAVGDRRT